MCIVNHCFSWRLTVNEIEIFTDGDQSFEKVGFHDTVLNTIWPGQVFEVAQYLPNGQIGFAIFLVDPKLNKIIREYIEYIVSQSFMAQNKSSHFIGSK